MKTKEDVLKLTDTIKNDLDKALYITGNLDAYNDVLYEKADKIDNLGIKKKAYSETEEANKDLNIILTMIEASKKDTEEIKTLLNNIYSTLFKIEGKK